MLFLILRKDRPGSLDVRLETYAKHLAYLAPYKSKLVVGGPTLGAGTGTNDQDMTGSFLIIEAVGWTKSITLSRMIRLNKRVYCHDDH